jgi:putative transposase
VGHHQRHHARKLKSSAQSQFWQRRYYDFNVFTHAKTAEKLKYMHRNPVRRGLVLRPEEWPWSSFRHHATGRKGTIEIESDWTSWDRERKATTGGDL